MSDWFKESREEIKLRFDEDFELVCQLLAGTSPIADIKSNVSIALQCYRSIKLDGELPKSCLINTRYLCVTKLMAGDITGRKVWSLYQNLLGNEWVCAIDRHVLRYFKLDINHLDVSTYGILESILVKEAIELGTTPAQRQADIWYSMRAGRGYESYGSILRKREITKANLLNRLL